MHEFEKLHAAARTCDPLPDAKNNPAPTQSTLSQNFKDALKYFFDKRSTMFGEVFIRFAAAETTRFTGWRKPPLLSVAG